MPIVETPKRKFAQVTGFGAPSLEDIAAALKEVEVKAFRFNDDGRVPNHPRWPFLVYPQTVRLAGVADPAALFEAIFKQNGWGGAWRNGVYPYVHFHSMIHEVLGVARGRARVRFGGHNGAEIEMAFGDVAVLPAGTGHQRLDMSADFLVVGAYPPEGEYDVCRDSAEEHARAVKTVAGVPCPRSDPLFGPAGPLVTMWA